MNFQYKIIKWRWKLNFTCAPPNIVRFNDRKKNGRIFRRFVWRVCILWFSILDCFHKQNSLCEVCIWKVMYNNIRYFIFFYFQTIFCYIDINREELRIKCVLFKLPIQCCLVIINFFFLSKRFFFVTQIKKWLPPDLPWFIIHIFQIFFLF